MFVGKKEDPIMMIVLTIVTCTIWKIIWSFRVTKEINQSAGRELVPSYVPIVGIFLPPLEIYFYDKALQEFCPEKGVTYDSKMVVQLVLSFVSGIGFYWFLHSAVTTLNQVWEKAEGGSATA
ncbi:MAG: DUF4234 domain-containing protein [Oscillospiraceae bacterium]|nr:DUF4234 domain-containing protein [Oscillospiraceae bacterium]